MPIPPLIDIDLIRDWLNEAGRMALSQWADRIVDIKADLTPVTQIDRQVENFLLERIERTYPSHGILAEEGSFHSGNDFTWIIDPIDGTRAFIAVPSSAHRHFEISYPRLRSLGSVTAHLAYVAYGIATAA